MKRFTAVLLALILLLGLTACGKESAETGNSGENGNSGGNGNAEETAAEAVRSPLDEAFDSGKPTMKKTGDTVLKPVPEEIEITDGLRAFAEKYGHYPNQDETAEDLLRETELRLLSGSPAGNSGIVYSERAIFALYDGKYRVIYPSDARSAEGAFSVQPDTDTLQLPLIKRWMNLSRLSMYYYPGGKIVYSPDGRYATMPDVRYHYEMGIFADPVIIDLLSGEMIQIAVHDAEGTGGWPIISAFSSDSRYYWYVMAGAYSRRANWSLYQYDLDAGTTKLCFEGEGRVNYPELTELRDGSWMMLSVQEESENTNSLINAVCREDEWSLSLTPIPSGPECLFQQVTYSRKSGLAYLAEKRKEREAEGGLAFHLFRPDDSFDGLDRFLCVTKDTHEMVSLSREEYIAAVNEAILSFRNTRGRVIESFSERNYPYELICESHLSPEGDYLLMRVYHEEAEMKEPVQRLLLVRLADMAVREVQGISPEELRDIGISKDMVAEWNAGGMIIGKPDGWEICTLTAGE